MNETGWIRRGAGIAALLVCISTGAAAESIHELALPGEALLPLDAHVLAVGGAAEARWDLPSGLPANPAQLLGLDGVTFSTVLQMRRGRRALADGTWDETRQDFPAFQVSAPLPGGVRLGVGYRADLRARGSFSESVSTEEVDYKLLFSQEGGLSRFPLSLAASVGERLRLGAALNLYRGNLSQEWVFDFPTDIGADDADQDYQDRKARRQADWRGSGLSFGLQARPLPALSASLRWEGAADLTGEEIVEIAGDEGTESRLLSGRMPSRWAAGLAYRLPGGVFFSTQFEHEAWSDYMGPLPTVALQNVNRIGLGLEWVRQHELRDRRAQRQFPLRLGLRIGNQPRPDPLTGGDVSERIISLGTGTEVQEGRGAIDLTIFWQRLTVSGGDEENRWGLALSLRTSEVWKKRTVPY